MVYNSMSPPYLHIKAHEIMLFPVWKVSKFSDHVNVKSLLKAGDVQRRITTVS